MSRMEKQTKEYIYEVGKPLLGQIVSCAGAITTLVIAGKGLIKEDDGLFYAGLIPAWFFMYSSYLYHKRFTTIFNENKSKNKLSKLEQDLDD